MEFDARLPEIYLKMKENDILILCADHGNDPTAAGFDHTREYIPVIVAGAKIKKGANIGTRTSFADIGATIAEYLGTEELSIGKSFLSEIME